MRRPWALPLVPLYRAAAAANAALYDRHLLPARTLRFPVVSVGSLSAGGAGKTPVVLALARLLSAAGISLDVLSRGYGRQSSAAAQVDAAGTAAQYGDEPLELAQAGLRVFVAAQRFAAGKLAETAVAHSASHLHLLDDGFQHRRLARAADLVLLTADDVRDHLLPGGNLREPLSALRRAHIVVLREEDSGHLADRVGPYTQAPIATIRRELILPEPMPRRPVVFCAIARPQSLLAMMRARGITPASTVTFPDHHFYTAADITRIAAAASASGADCFLTTAKDAVKLPPDLRAILTRVAPFATVQLRVSFQDEAAVLAHLLALTGLQPPPVRK